MRLPGTYSWKPLALFVAGLSIITLTYSLALPGIFLFDDAPNLERLATLSDWRSQLSFIFSGEAGPLGRPLSLATFVVQKAAWPDHSESMLRVNIVIHILAVCAVFILALGLARARLKSSDLHAVWIATAISLLWGLSPFLATTHLMIIQRMTSLAGLFVFLGLAGFVWAHLLAQRRRLLSEILLVLSLGFGTVLAALSKENGVLLPALAAIILWLWIPRSLRLTTSRGKLAVLFGVVLPTLLILSYLLFSTVQILEGGYGAHRQFTPIQRLLTQPEILLNYLKNLLLPQAVSVTPFTDDIAPASSLFDRPITLGSILTWAVLVGISTVFRKRTPYVLFGFAFFLTAHLLESTIFGLELYFAHRNYIPAFGIYFAIVFAATNLPLRYRRIGTIGLGIYGILFTIVLAQATSQWNRIGITSEIWLQNHPHSTRAAQFLATQYLKFDAPGFALAILDQSANHNPNNATIQLQRTLICHSRESSFQERLYNFKARAGRFPLDLPVVGELVRIAKSDLGSYCAELEYSDIADIADVLLSNKNYRENSYAESHILIAKGFAEAEQGNTKGAIKEFVNAFHVYPHLDTAFTAMSLMSNAGLYKDARMFLNEVRQAAPSNTIRNVFWQQQVDAYSDILERSKLLDDPS